MKDKNKNNLQEMLNYLQKKVSFFKELVLLSEKQKEKIKNEDYEMLEDIINQKNVLINKIDKIDSNYIKAKEWFAKYYARGEERLFQVVDRNNNVTEEIRKQSEALKGVVDKYRDLEGTNLSLMKKVKNEMSKDLETVSSGIKRNNSYNKLNKKIYSTYIDKKR